MVMIKSRTRKHLLQRGTRVQNDCLTTLFQHVSTTNSVAYFIMNEEQKKKKTLNDVKK